MGWQAGPEAGVTLEMLAPPIPVWSSLLRVWCLPFVWWSFRAALGSIPRSRYKDDPALGTAALNPCRVAPTVCHHAVHRPPLCTGLGGGGNAVGAAAPGTTCRHWLAPHPLPQPLPFPVSKPFCFPCHKMCFSDGLAEKTS